MKIWNQTFIVSFNLNQADLIKQNARPNLHIGSQDYVSCDQKEFFSLLMDQQPVP
jgi:hypothetical protein